MSDQHRGEIVAAMNVLVRRRAATADPVEQAAIDDALDTLAGLLQALNQAGLLDTAKAVAQASDALERVVASARMGPFDNFLSDMQTAIAKLHTAMGQLQGSERLPAAPVPAAARTRGGPQVLAAAPVAPVSAPAPAAAAASVSVSAGIPVPINSKRFEDLRDEYSAFFQRAELRPEFAGNVEFYISRLLKNKAVYQQTGTPLGIPWAFIGIVHGMECGFNFQTHLHNGDPLTRRTVRVPRGRPLAGDPPFTWIESARDALLLKKLNEITDWGVPRMLYQLEGYNGYGYRARGIPTPYLWSFSTLYKSGKFVDDGVFDPAAVSKQCGAALMLKTLQQRGAL
jgi:lysozyme family protein